jgi:hypothetical protein
VVLDTRIPRTILSFLGQFRYPHIEVLLYSSPEVGNVSILQVPNSEDSAPRCNERKVGDSRSAPVFAYLRSACGDAFSNSEREETTGLGKTLQVYVRPQEWSPVFFLLQMCCSIAEILWVWAMSDWNRPLGTAENVFPHYPRFVLPSPLPCALILFQNLL